jgi:hypothetical protein
VDVALQVENLELMVLLPGVALLATSQPPLPLPVVPLAVPVVLSMPAPPVAAGLPLLQAAAAIQVLTQSLVVGLHRRCTPTVTVTSELPVERRDSDHPVAPEPGHWRRLPLPVVLLAVAVATA